MSRKPEPTKDEVREKFLELLEDAGQITSLEVKNSLREDDFWSTQMVIGPMIRDIADEEDIRWDFNGTYRTYYDKASAEVTQTAGLIPVQSRVKKNPIDSIDRARLEQPEDGCWECREITGDYIKLYFSSKLTAGQARYAYQIEIGVNYVDIRSRTYTA